MLDRTSRQDTELSTPAAGVLMRGMRAAILDWLLLDCLMLVSLIERIRGLEGVSIGVLKAAQILVKHWVIVIEAGEVKTWLGRESMVS